MKFSKEDSQYMTAEQYPYIKWEGTPYKVPNDYYNFIEVFVSGNQVLGSLGGD